jgi:hypothetical protein
MNHVHSLTSITVDLVEVTSLASSIFKSEFLDDGIIELKVSVLLT